MSNIFTKKGFARLGLLVAAVVMIVAMLPRSGQQSISYEQGQPWRYPLLTAPFDIPVYLDSATMTKMTDSINKNFAPYVIRDDMKSEKVNEKLRLQVLNPVKTKQLAELIEHVYTIGVVSPELKSRIDGLDTKEIRTLEEDNVASVADASALFSTDAACKWVADHYEQTFGLFNGLESADIKAIRNLIEPNVTLDSINDERYLSQAYQDINASQGKIRQGQRIVDRGDIVTPQIFTNLQTYEEMLANRDSGNDHSLVYIAGQTAYVLICFGLFYLFLYLYRRKYYDSVRMMVFLMSIVTLFVLFTLLLAETFAWGFYMSPFAAVPVIILIFTDSRTAIFSLVVAVLITSVAAIYQFTFIVVELTAGLVATFSLKQLSRRSQLLRTAFFTLVAYLLCFTVCFMVSRGKVMDLDWKIPATFGINVVLLSFAYVLVVMIEKLFGFTSTVTLVELSDINNPLLRRLAEEAPGTFQHSMQVSTLAAEAARAIGANTQLVRTGALYHDIGKLESPVFFTENQHGINPHDGLEPHTSAKKIISHITEGMKLASKAKLPQVIKDFILQHHGRGVVRYFYTIYANSHEGEAVDVEPFTYPGPDPQSRETAILMMADAVEAASRSLKEYTPESISGLVDKIIDSQVAEGRFKESPISFGDIEKVKQTFKKRLATIYHTRVAYPDKK